MDRLVNHLAEPVPAAPSVDAWYAGNPAVAAVDAHAHVFARGLPLAPVIRHAPDYDASLDAYVAHLAAHGITHAVLVQPSFLGTDNTYFVDVLRRYPQRFRGVAMVDPAISDSELDALDRAGVVGMRLNLVGLPIPDFGAPVWRALFARINALGWHVEIHRGIEDLHAITAPLLAQSCTLVIDHFGRPSPTLGERAPSFRRLLLLADTGRVWVKLSAAYRNSVAGDGAIDAFGAARALRTAFTAERLVWGSDWPHTQHRERVDFDGAYAALARWLPDPGERMRVLRDAPRTLFRFDQ
ncbi:amidohydrolase family protein [Burkholderia sp. Ac-20349]|uniref:amidohydrolase family protein n=1 Tax=Burkholderia sp. Ac-20349 TaxID=2703893 RepID=UPI00197C7D2E|nr:amidohydrolase family protein [Burkholderia sp. Ac-20349]MBN3840262.1 amidohydrolase family protein [Burkholderia sp. Ac-20349]